MIVILRPRTPTRSAISRRRWFQFSLRGLLVLTTVVAIFFGLWVSKLHRRQQALNDLRGLITTPWRNVIRSRDLPHTSWLRQKWLTRLVGEGFFDQPGEIRLTYAMRQNGLVRDADLRPIGQLSTLERLHLDNTRAGDEGMPYLRALQNLEQLNLGNSRAGDDAMTSLPEMAKLEELDLASTRVTDEGVRHLAGLAKLKILNLRETKVGDEGIAWLKNLNKLVSLDLAQTQVVTGRGFAAIPELPALERLDLSGTALDDEGLQKLPATPALRRLNLNDTLITDEGLKRLAE